MFYNYLQTFFSAKIKTKTVKIIKTCFSWDFHSLTELARVFLKFENLEGLVIFDCRKLTLFYDYLMKYLLVWFTLETCKENGKVYTVGQSFIRGNFSGWCTCKGEERVACVSLCPPEIVRCKQGEKKEYYKDYINESKCFCKTERCVKGNWVMVT